MGTLRRSAGRNSVTAERVRYWLRYDAATGAFSWVHPASRRCKPGDSAVSINKGRATVGCGGYRFPAGHIAWLHETGEWPRFEIDHVDRDPLNNSFSNLRDVTTAKNCMNQTKRSSNRSGFKGVHEHTQRPGWWWAKISADGHRYDLGVYPEAWMAAAAYKIAAAGMHAEFSGV